MSQAELKTAGSEEEPRGDANPVQTTAIFGVIKRYNVSDLQFHSEAEQAVNGYIGYVGVSPFHRNPGV